MEGKFIVFVVFAITADVIAPVFGKSDAAKDETYQLKIDTNLSLDPLNTLVEAIYGSLALAKPSDLSKLIKYQCGTYSTVEKMFGSLRAGVEIIQEKNCSRVSEIEQLENSALSAATELVNNIFVGLRSTGINQVNFGDKIVVSEEETNSRLTGAIRSLFQGMKIILSEMCPENPLVKVENSIESLNIAETETSSQLNAMVDTIFNQVGKIYGTFVDPVASKLGVKLDSMAIDSERNKASHATVKLVHDVFNTLKISLMDVLKVKGERNQENCKVE